MASDLKTKTDVGPVGQNARSETGGGRRLDSERYSLVAVMELVRSGRATTRLEVERLSGLSRAVTTDRLATLAELGLVEEGELGQALGGRAPRLLRFRAGAGRILVATADHTTVGVGLADLAGRLAVEHYEPVDPVQGSTGVIRRMGKLFDWVLDQYQEHEHVWGIGVGVPGSLYSFEEFEPAVDWQKALLKEDVVARHRAPIWVRSLVQLATVGEFGVRTEAGMTDRDFLFVELGNEISIGLISDGWLHRGAQGVAGNVGHIALGNSKEVCRCGNVGCVELLAGSVAIARAGLLAAQDGRSRYLAEALEASRSIAVADVGFAARLGDPFCAELLSRSGDMIGQALASAINAFNPAVIVLGGEVARTGDIVLAAIREAIYRHSTPVVTRDLRIVRSQMGRSAGLVGAARLAVDALFAPEMLSGWITSGTPLLHPHIDSLA